MLNYPFNNGKLNISNYYYCRSINHSNHTAMSSCHLAARFPNDNFRRPRKWIWGAAAAPATPPYSNANLSIRQPYQRNKHHTKSTLWTIISLCTYVGYSTSTIDRPSVVPIGRRALSCSEHPLSFHQMCQNHEPVLKD